jgi:hypothetical protein
MKRSIRVVATLLLTIGMASSAWGAIEYVISGGHADLTLSIDPDETVVYLNTFPVDPAGQYIDLIRVAYGRVGGPSSLNRLPVKILLYEDPDGGSPQDATLLWSIDTSVANGNTDTLNQYPVPGILVHGTLVAAFYFRNTTPLPVFIGALATSPPLYSQRSYFGYVGELETVDPANLGAIPPGQFMAQEDSSHPGNYRIEARGRSIEESINLSVSRVVAPDVVRLAWTASHPAYTVYRASRPDFSDAATIAVGVSGPTYDDPIVEDGTTWFYRVE